MAGSKKQIRDALEASLPKLGSVMEQLGRVTLAIWFADVTLDTTGCNLTGRAEAYRTLSQNLSLREKSDVVREMCLDMILDTQTREHAAAFCNRLKWLEKERDEILHSFFGSAALETTPLGASRKITRVTMNSLPEFAARIWEHIESSRDIARRVGRAMGQSQSK